MVIYRVVDYNEPTSKSKKKTDHFESFTCARIKTAMKTIDKTLYSANDIFLSKTGNAFKEHFNQILNLQLFLQKL